MKWLVYALILALFVSSAIAPAFAKEINVPGDSNGDKIVSAEELKAAEKLSQEGKITSKQLNEIKNIHENYPKTITDSANQMVTIYKPIQRAVIAYWIDAAITLQALKAEDSVVGITASIAQAPELFPKLSKLPVIGKLPRAESIDFEKVLELEPDVVITGGNGSKWEAIEKKFQSLDSNIVVLRFDCAQPTTYIDEVNKIAYLFDKKEESKELIDFIDGHLSQIKEKVSNIPQDKKTKVYSEFFTDCTAAGNAGSGEYIKLAGGDNVFSDLSSESTVDPEDVIKRNPEIIIHHVGSTYAGKVGYDTDNVTALREKRNEILNRTGFKNIVAVKNGKVYTCVSDIVRNAIYPVGICYYAKWFYPELFKDLDPNAVHQEYLKRFLRVDYDLSKHGVFVYHPTEHPKGR